MQLNPVPQDPYDNFALAITFEFFQILLCLSRLISKICATNTQKIVEIALDIIVLGGA